MGCCWELLAYQWRSTQLFLGTKFHACDKADLKSASWAEFSHDGLSFFRCSLLDEDRMIVGTVGTEDGGAAVVTDAMYIPI